MMKSCPGGAFAFRPRAGAGASPQGGNCSAPWRESAFLPPSQMAGFLPRRPAFCCFENGGKATVPVNAVETPDTGVKSVLVLRNTGRETVPGRAVPVVCHEEGPSDAESGGPLRVHGRIGYLALFTASKSFSMSSSGLAVRRLTTMMAMQATMKAGRSS